MNLNKVFLKVIVESCFVLDSNPKEVNFNINLCYCRFGGTEGATFCALTTLCKELETFNAIDVYQVAKLYHNKRPGIWKSPVI